MISVLYRVVCEQHPKCDKFFNGRASNDMNPERTKPSISGDDMADSDRKICSVAHMRVCKVLINF